MLSKQKVSLSVVKKNHSKTFFLIHFCVYILFCVILIAFVFHRPYYSWIPTITRSFVVLVIIPMVWLIGLCEHFAAYRIKSRGVYPRAKKGLYYNLAAFLGSLPLLVLSFYIFIGIAITIWGSILIIHYVLSHIAGTEPKGRDVGNISIKKFNGFSEESLKIIALKKVRFRLSLQIHSGLFLGIIIIMFLGTIFSSNSIANFFIPLVIASGWFVFLSLHGTAYFIYAYGVYPKVKRGYYYNLIAFLSSILFQFITMSVVLLGPVWGVAVLIHYITYRIISRKSGIKEGIKKTHLQRLVEKEMEKMKSLM